jgi:hypothetical protein
MYALSACFDDDARNELYEHVLCEHAIGKKKTFPAKIFYTANVVLVTSSENIIHHNGCKIMRKPHLCPVSPPSFFAGRSLDEWVSRYGCHIKLSAQIKNTEPMSDE